MGNGQIHNLRKAVDARSESRDNLLEGGITAPTRAVATRNFVLTTAKALEKALRQAETDGTAADPAPLFSGVVRTDYLVLPAQRSAWNWGWQQEEGARLPGRMAFPVVPGGRYGRAGYAVNRPATIGKKLHFFGI